MTHAELVERAVRWLRNSAVVFDCANPRLRRKRARCKIVFAEHHSFATEIPDVIGWFAGGKHSVLIEAKTSLTDFGADRRKKFRRESELGVGRFRYYFTAPGLLDRTALPDGWGWVECLPARVGVVRLARPQPVYNATREVEMLYAALRRGRQEGLEIET